MWVSAVRRRWFARRAPASSATHTPWTDVRSAASSSPLERETITHSMVSRCRRRWNRSFVLRTERPVRAAVCGAVRSSAKDRKRERNRASKIFAKRKYRLFLAFAGAYRCSPDPLRPKPLCLWPESHPDEIHSQNLRALNPTGWLGADIHRKSAFSLGSTAKLSLHSARQSNESARQMLVHKRRDCGAKESGS